MQKATDVFLRHGRSVSMDRLAAEADISKVTIYKYFASKDALFLACTEDCLVRIMPRFDELTSVDLLVYPTLRVAIETVSLSYVDALAGPTYLALRSMIWAEAEHSSEMAQLWSHHGPITLIDQAHRLLSGLVEAGLLRIDDMDLAVLEIAVIVHGPGTLHALLGTALTPERSQRLIRHGVEMYLTAYATAPLDTPLASLL